VIIQNTLGQTIYQKDFSNQSEIGVELQNLDETKITGAINNKSNSFFTLMVLLDH
tara:strand:- start:23 stop:187 length:165 start_codon:yes stop_codon:yes gene_type:complete